MSQENLSPTSSFEPSVLLSPKVSFLSNEVKNRKPCAKSGQERTFVQRTLIPFVVIIPEQKNVVVYIMCCCQHRQ